METDISLLSSKVDHLSGQISGLQVQLATSNAATNTKDGVARTWVAPIITAILSSGVMYMLVTMLGRGVG